MLIMLHTCAFQRPKRKRCYFDLSVSSETISRVSQRETPSAYTFASVLSIFDKNAKVYSCAIRDGGAAFVARTDSFRRVYSSGNENTFIGIPRRRHSVRVRRHGGGVNAITPTVSITDLRQQL